MFFIWGSGTKTVVAAQDAGVQHCSICNNNQTFRTTLTYGYRHFWYLIRFVTSRSYSCVCNRCNNGYDVQRSAIADKLTSDPVPFMDRRGWMVGAGAAGAVIALAVVVGIQHDGELGKMLAAPHVGDIYEADLSKISTGFNDPPAYGLMKLVELKDGKATFHIAQHGYGKKRAAHKEYTSGSYKAGDYFLEEDTASYSLEELKVLFNTRTVYDINRP